MSLCFWISLLFLSLPTAPTWHLVLPSPTCRVGLSLLLSLSVCLYVCLSVHLCIFSLPPSVALSFCISSPHSGSRSLSLSLHICLTQCVSLSPAQQPILRSLACGETSLRIHLRLSFSSGSLCVFQTHLPLSRWGLPGSSSPAPLSLSPGLCLPLLVSGLHRTPISQGIPQPG